MPADSTYSLENCKVLGVLRTDLSDIPKFRFEKAKGKNGKECYKVEYELHAHFRSADIKVEFQFKSTY
jgi:hypothetical protein